MKLIKVFFECGEKQGLVLKMQSVFVCSLLGTSETVKYKSGSDVQVIHVWNRILFRHTRHCTVVCAGVFQPWKVYILKLGLQGNK